MTAEQSANTDTTSPPAWAFHIYLCDIKKDLCEQWTQQFTKNTPLKQLDALGAFDRSRITYSVHNKTIENMVKDVSAECIMSPANSFGLMDGGVDMNLSRMYGGTKVTIPHVQKKLDIEWAGQQNVATCCIIDLDPLRQALAAGAHLPRYLAHTPTMRTPKVLYIKDDLVYRSTWSILIAIRRHNLSLGPGDVRINSVILMGLGTAVGRIPSELCAQQMALACKHFFEAPANGNPEKDLNKYPNGYLRTWTYATDVEVEIEETVEMAGKKWLLA